MRRSSSWLRYVVALFALLAGLVLSIRWSERGVLLDSPSATALSTHTDVDNDTWDLSSMRVFNQVLLQIRANYVDPSRVHPLKMLTHALDYLQNSAPEIVTIFNTPMNQHPTSVKVTVGDATRDFDISGVDTHWQLAFKMREIFQFIQKNADLEKTDLQDLEYAAINGMLSTLDPHSDLLDPKVFKDMQASNRGHFGGLGIVISLRDDKLTVISPIADTPASRAGFKAGDRIVKINDESTINMSLNEAVSILRGKPGSKVTIQIMRDGWSEPHEFKITREIINIESVSHHQLSHGIGYITIRSFQGNTHDELLKALSDLHKNGKIKGLVLDLRNDPGGLLQQAIEVADTFLSKGTIVTTVGVSNRLREQTSATEANTQQHYPIVVLTNAGTASAAEIVTGALKHHDRAIVVGDVTFGKGSVQNIYPFRDGSALKLTIAQYLTPGDISIQGVGVMPDIHVIPATISDDSIDLYPPDHVMRESSLRASLTNQHTRDIDEKPSALVRFYKKADESDQSAVLDPHKFKIDFEISFAEKLLRATGTAWKRPAFLNNVKSTIEHAVDKQALRVQEKLRHLNVDWSAGPTIRQPLDVSITTDKSKNRADAGQPIAVTVHVTNKGTKTLYRVRAITDSDYRLLNDQEFVFGRIPAGKTRSWTVHIDVPKEAPSRVDKMAFKFWSGDVDLEHEASTKVRIQGIERPHWGFSWWIDDTQDGNGDGILQKGETVNLDVLIRNTGAGDAGETVSYIHNKSDSDIFINTGRATVDSLPKGESTLSNFQFKVQKMPEDGAIELDANVLDTQFREYLSEALTIPVQKKQDAVAIEKVKKFARINADNTPIYPAPRAKRKPLAKASRGTVLNVDAQTTGWYRVRWNDQQIGWVPEGGASLQSSGPTRGKVSDQLQYQAPIIHLEQKAMEVSKDHYTIRGIVTDESKVKDFFVMVNSRVAPERRHTTKRAYRAVNASSAAINIDVPLGPGSNQIIVVAEDDQGVSSTARIFVYRNE